MNKRNATVLLIIVLVLTAVLTFFAFASFPVGVKDYNGFLGAIQTDYDLGGGNAYVLTLAKDNEEDVENVDQVTATLKNRLSQLGYNEFRIVALKNVDNDVKDHDIRIEIRANSGEDGKEDVSTLNSDITVAAAYGEVIIYGGTSANPTETILTEGDPIADAEYTGATSDGSSTYYQVSITFSDYGYKELMKLLNENSEYYVQINLGDTVLLSGGSALSSSYFNGKTLAITSSSETSAKQFALQIKTGGLAYKYDITSLGKISAPIGKGAVTGSVVAMAIFVFIIVLAMFLINKGYGLVNFCTAILSLDIYLFLLIAVPGIKMTLGGVIAFGVSWLFVAIGGLMTSFRIKEEYGKGKTVKSAVKTAFNRSIAPLVGGFLAVEGAALAIMAFATGVAFNFAVVLAIGTVVAAFATLVLNRMFSALLLAIVENKEKFIGLKREEIPENGVAEEE